MADVLIADSSEDVALLYAVALRRHGHSVALWSRGDRVEQPVDVVVLDAALTSAAEVAAGVRAARPDVELIATGIRTLPAEKAPHGACVYFRKPFALADLATAVALVTPTGFLPAAHRSSY